MMNPKKGINDDEIEPTDDEGAALNILYTNIPGTRPKLTKSAKEASWIPISDFASNFLAI